MLLTSLLTAINKKFSMNKFLMLDNEHLDFNFVNNNDLTIAVIL